MDDAERIVRSYRVEGGSELGPDTGLAAGPA
jgi:hypothetical protein